MKTCRTLLILALAAWPAAAQACATCGGSDDAKLVNASNTVLWALLGLVIFIFVATAGTVYFLWKKSQAHAATAGLTQYLPSPNAAD